MQVENFKPKRSGALIGFVDVTMPKVGLVLMGCPVFEKNGHIWAQPPSQAGDDGKWYARIKFQDFEIQKKWGKEVGILVTSQFLNDQKQASFDPGSIENAKEYEDVPF